MIELAELAVKLKGFQERLQTTRKLIQAGRLHEARTVISEVLQLENGYFAAWFLLGVILSKEKKWVEAAGAFGRAAMLNPEDGPTQLNLARAYIEISAYLMAEQTLKGLISREPKNANAYRALGKCYLEDKEHVLAIESLKKAVLLDPEHIETLHAVATAHGELGETDRAAEYYFAALSLALKQPRKLSKLPSIVSQILGLPIRVNLREIESALAKAEHSSANLTKRERETLLFAKARALERRGEYSESWKVLKDANAKALERIDQPTSSMREQLSRSLDFAKISSKADEAAGVSISKDLPLILFIVGASRCGKTSMERLLGATPSIERGYESRIVEHSVIKTSLQLGLPKFSDFWLLPDGSHDLFANVFSSALIRRSGGKEVFTVTYPGSIHHAGRLAKVLSNAFFIFMRRDIDDQALRCFQKNYKNGNGYSYDWLECRSYLEKYDELSKYWAEQIASRSLSLRYEDLVKNPINCLQRVEQLLGVSIRKNSLPDIGDDRGCFLPYKELIT